MNLRKAVVSALQLFAAASFFAAALFFLSLPFLLSARLQIASILLNSAEICTPIGIGFLIAAILLLVGFYGANRGRILHVQMGSRSASIGREVLQKTLEECFQRNFPELISLTDIAISWGKKLEIEVRLAPLKEEAREELYIEVQKKLQPLLEERFGYSKPFLLIVKTQ